MDEVAQAIEKIREARRIVRELKPTTPACAEYKRSAEKHLSDAIDLLIPF